MTHLPQGTGLVWDAKESGMSDIPEATGKVTWQDIDTAPISNGSVRFLTHITGHGCSVCYAGAGRFIYSSQTGKRIHAATNWMPLPLPPARHSPSPEQGEQT